MLQAISPCLPKAATAPEAIYERFKLHDLSYLRNRAMLLKRLAAPGRMLGDIWDGDGKNRGAVQTVYRHFDSAFVVPGAVGGLPKTAWVLDSPMFERMYYDLLAGFDVFGNVVHQVSTRRYVKLLRIEAESLLLSFSPESRRRAVRDFWYRPPEVAKVADLLEPPYSEPETRVTFSDPVHAKEELLTRLVFSELHHAVLGDGDPIQWHDMPDGGAGAASQFERAVRTIVRREARVPAEDTLHVVRGVIASRPNLFLIVHADEVAKLVADVLALPRDLGWAKFLDRYGVRRSDSAFWATSDFFNEGFSKLDPLGAGILDLSRYVND